MAPLLAPSKVPLMAQPYEFAKEQQMDLSKERQKEP